MAIQQPVEVQVDAFLPPVMATRMESTGVKKCAMDTAGTFVLAILAGAFIAAGAMFATTVTAGLATSGVGFGLIRLLSGIVFSMGLIAVVVAGAELFTGNNLIVMAFANGKVTLTALLRNWAIVFVGNFVGSIATAAIMLVSKQYTFGNGAVGANALATANSKTGLDFVQAIALGMMCNALVCLAVWLSASGRTTTDKILAVIFPISAFVAAGFEHNVANMYFIPIGLFIKDTASPAFWELIKSSPDKFANLTWPNFFIANLLPVTIGNIIGGAGMVGLIYWFVYLRPKAAGK